MSSSATATYYDAANQRPRPAAVSWTSPEALQVEVGGERLHWSMHDKHFAWEISADALRVSYGHPPGVLIIRDPLVMQAWIKHFQQSGVKRRRAATVPWLIRIPLMLPLGFIAACVALYLWVLPPVAERLALALPSSADVRIGDAMYAGLTPSMHLDSTRSAALQRFGDRLQLAPSFQLHYHVADDPQVNAFALPGGHIVVYTGLLDKLGKPTELAALLAHEATHVEKRHTTRGVARDLAGSIFLALVVGDASAVANTAARKADELRGLGYSRALESEADAAGLERLSADHVDPQGMVDLLHVLEQAGEDMPVEAGFLSTHPLTKDRLQEAEQAVANYGPAPLPDPALQEAFDALRAK